MSTTPPDPAPVASFDSPTGIHEIDFYNDFSYHIGYDDFPPAIVLDGEAENGEFGDDDFYYFAVTEIDYGDLTGDGIDEAAVSTSVNFGGSGNFSAVQVFALRDGDLTLVGSQPFGDRAFGGLQRTEIVDGVLRAWSFDGGQGACCADVIIETRLILAGSSLVPAETLGRQRWLSPNSLSETPEIEFLPDTSSAVVTVFAPAADAAVTFDAAVGQYVSIELAEPVLQNAPAEISLVHLDSTDAQIVIGDDVRSAGFLLRQSGLHRLAFSFDHIDRGESSSFEITITDDEPSPDASNTTWKPAGREVVIDDPYDIRGTAAWPVLSGPAPGIAVANDHIAALASLELQHWIDDVTIHSEPQGDSAFELVYDVAFLSDSLVSVSFAYYDYVCCRPYPNSGQRALVVDLIDGHVISTEDIVDLSRLGELHSLWVTNSKTKVVDLTRSGSS